MFGNNKCKKYPISYKVYNPTLLVSEEVATLIAVELDQTIQLCAAQVHVRWPWLLAMAELEWWQSELKLDKQWRGAWEYFKEWFGAFKELATSLVSLNYWYQLQVKYLPTLKVQDRCCCIPLLTRPSVS